MHASDGVLTPDEILDRDGRPVTATTYDQPAPTHTGRARRAATPTGQKVLLGVGAAFAAAVGAAAGYWFAGPVFVAACIAGVVWAASRATRSAEETPAMHTHHSPPAGSATVPAGTATYRIRVFDANYEVLPDRLYLVRLDLLGAAATAILAAQLETLTAQAIAARETMTAPRLEVWDLVTGRKVLDVA